MARPSSQLYPLNLYLKNNVEDIVVFLGLKVLSSDDLDLYVVNMHKL